MEIHVLNVQAPFCRHISQFSNKKNRGCYHREEAEKALTPTRRLLESHGVPYVVHVEGREQSAEDRGYGAPFQAANHMLRNTYWLLSLLIVLTGLLPGVAMAQRALSQGQYLYLPIYAFIQYGDIGKSGSATQVPVSALVSIHNTDLDKPLRLLFAHYYSTEGKLLRNFVLSPRLLRPMETVEIMVERRDIAGGSGANFVIQWQSLEGPMSPPLVQALHAELQFNRAIVFTTDAVLIPR